MLKPLIQIQMNTAQSENQNNAQTQLTKSRAGRKKLPLEEKVARQRERWKRRYGDKTVFQARTNKEGKRKLEMMRKYLGFTSNDQLLDWFIERGERSIARKEGGFDFEKLE